ncbi:hypothetical protein [Pseudoalteromonas marina]|uniref:hypothetical protein n=1 Tax=Pseudoalteromonas marina TaxID=267375 RepID=UPI0027326A0A|nr:hypothetical protein [Pseudoalteromonas marina]MDP2487425.1 hypothetical protein [Pseudoalteromonas marina]
MNNILKFLFRGLASASNLILALVLVNVLEKNITGMFFTLQATMIVFSLILRFGVDENIIRYINSYESNVIYFLVQKIKKILLLLSIPTLISLFIFIKSLDFNFSILDFLLFFICVFLFSLLSLFGRFFQAKEKHTEAILILNLLMPCFLILTIYIFSLFLSLNLKLLVLCFIIASFLTCCICFVMLNKSGNELLITENKTKKYSGFEFYKSSFFLLCIVFLQNFPFWFISIYPMKHLGAEAVAVLNFNLKIASAISIFSVFLNFIIAPKMAKKYTSDFNGFIVFYIKCLLLCFISSVFIGGLFVIFYDISIEVLNIKDYKSTKIFYSFVFFYVFYSVCIYMTMIYSMIGKQSISLFFYALTFLIFVLVGFFILTENIESYSYLMLTYIISNFFFLFCSQITYLHRKKYA